MSASHEIIGAHAPFWTLTDWIEEGQPSIVTRQSHAELVEWWRITVKNAWEVINDLADALDAINVERGSE